MFSENLVRKSLRKNSKRTRKLTGSSFALAKKTGAALTGYERSRIIEFSMVTREQMILLEKKLHTERLKKWLLVGIAALFILLSMLKGYRDRVIPNETFAIVALY
ncbi:hypothetical protein SJAG_02438 [Schizosaccharomyces japonicus yFS275]|uniref:Uncharacterized protein n=1 Tax=Schizosaccharomyces japonicus (strain yFS275 / FY16936) TaxID=402676 RepID=B6K2G9_SCHJY|nr:hypothetical protein SJAG_02438 [Schizosaccharomyces japonicus yFS275]EEB07350.1 hypothetical protein SJAG_02438 [Schizosaccharomyces japonicus yFS275]